MRVNYIRIIFNYSTPILSLITIVLCLVDGNKIAALGWTVATIASLNNLLCSIMHKQANKDEDKELNE